MEAARTALFTRSRRLIYAFDDFLAPEHRDYRPGTRWRGTRLQLCPLRQPYGLRVRGALAALEGEGRAFAFASGMAAMHAALTAAELGSGSTVLAAEQLYGSTATLLVQIFGPAGVEVRFVDAYDLGAVEKKVRT